MVPKWNLSIRALRVFVGAEMSHISLGDDYLVQRIRLLFEGQQPLSHQGNKKARLRAKTFETSEKKEY